MNHRWTPPVKNCQWQRHGRVHHAGRSRQRRSRQGRPSENATAEMNGIVQITTRNYSPTLETIRGLDWLNARCIARRPVPGPLQWLLMFLAWTSLAGGMVWLLIGRSTGLRRSRGRTSRPWRLNRTGSKPIA